MKNKILIATATAASVLMTAAALADSNSTALIQTGGNNSALVEQSGTSNEAGRNAYTEQLIQEGDNNSLSVQQTGTRNMIGAHSVDGVKQKFDKNILVVTQDTALNGSVNGNQIWKVRQTGIAGAANTTNKITVTQARVDGVDATVLRALNTITMLVQTGGGAGLNEMTIKQFSKQDGWWSDRQGNTIGTASQVGSLNTLNIRQEGTGPTVSGLLKGPANAITTVSQTGDSNIATLNQNGQHNLITLVSQNSSLAATGNSATVSLTGNENGRGGLTGGALASGATSSTVTQIGGSNLVSYTVIGSYNEYGFHQDGTGNQANNILITGNYNKLGVKQVGNRNVLLLATISGSDNNVGLSQLGSDNAASLTIAGSGNRNGGYTGFTGAPASTAGLTAGLLDQLGNWNSVSLNVTGSDNVFATRQDSGAYAGSSVTNTIVGTISGDFNQVAVKQIGVGNLTNFTQSGSSNNAYISQ